MTGWYAERMPDRAAKAVTAVTLLALLLVTAVPVALLAAVVIMMLGHVIGGLALFGGSILAAASARWSRGMTGMRTCASLVLQAASVSCTCTAASTPTRTTQDSETPTSAVDRSETPKFADLTLRVIACRSAGNRRSNPTPSTCRGPGAGREPLIDDEVAERFLPSTRSTPRCGARECVEPADHDAQPGQPATVGGSLEPRKRNAWPEDEDRNRRRAKRLRQGLQSLRDTMRVKPYARRFRSRIVRIRALSVPAAVC